MHGVAIRCSDCGSEIEDGKQCVVWELPDVRFVCVSCSEKYRCIAVEMPGECEAAGTGAEE